LQYLEFDYYIAPPIQIEFFQKYADMGADVIFGSQAHHPQGFAFGKGTSGTFIDYGTGNMFFDQMDSYELRQMRMDKLIIYDGHLLGTLLFTGLRENYSHTPPMTATERAQFLNVIFKASGWQGCDVQIITCHTAALNQP
jgi:poly-gamma-glutamate synthesis protein (capsule biosynthesis protein)